MDANDDWNDEVGCATVGGVNRHKDVWYSFIATGTAVEIVVTDISIGHILEVILAEPTTQPCAGPFNVWTTSCATTTTTLNYGSLVVGNTYYYTVSSPRDNVGTFEHCVTTSTPPATDNQDCTTSTPICDDNTFSGNSAGNGVQELTVGNQGCLDGEHQSSWYTFTIQNSGTLEMLINPASTDDYDFALWGPNPNCPPTSTPIRCSFALGTGNTGMGNGAPDLTEGVSGNSFVAPINALAGETYVLLVDNYSSSGNPFDLDWAGSAGLDCTVLPIELEIFDGHNNDNVVNKIYWVTATEINNDYFTLLRSRDGKNWTDIATIQGSGNSNTPIMYEFNDDGYDNGVNYYRLTQTDFNGASESFHIISINTNPISTYNDIDYTTDLIGRLISNDYTGLRIVVFKNKSRMLVFGELK